MSTWRLHTTVTAYWDEIQCLKPLREELLPVVTASALIMIIRDLNQI